jgi:integrase
MHRTAAFLRPTSSPSARRPSQRLRAPSSRSPSAILSSCRRSRRADPRPLKDAVRWGYLSRNVANLADLPKGMAPEMRVWSPGQLRAFLDQVRGDSLYAAWLLLATTGMRRGEVAGLRWSDVDLEVGRVSPRRPRVVVNYEVVVSVPKTAKGRRRWRWTRRRSPRSASTAPGSSSSGWRLACAGRTLGWGSPGRTVVPSTQRVSPGGSSSTPGRPACRRSACMTSATATRLPR